MQGIASAGAGVVGSITSYSTLPLVAAVGYSRVFWGYAAANLLIIAFLLRFV